MESQEFKHLFTPIKLGTVTVPNRIVFSAHANLFFEMGEAPNERAMHYFAARAKGGVGLIVTARNLVWPTTTAGGYCATQDDNARPAFEMLTKAIHEHGAKVVAQLLQPGPLARAYIFRGAGLAPSPIPLLAGGLLPSVFEIPHEIDIDEIKQIVAAYASAAYRMRETGHDGVEISASVGSGLLLVAFLSPRTNRRTDEYGGTLDNRLRFLMEINDAVREAVGPDFTVGVRLVGDEMMAGGLTLDDAKVIAQKLEASGKVDYLSVCAGLPGHVPPMYFPLGCFVYLAAAMKEVVDLPVICHGRINDPVQAEQFLSNNQADLIGMARALICDPEWPNKARKGRLDEIRKCIGCNQVCIGNYSKGIPITCTLNAEAGREKELAIIQATTRKKVMVIGGGAAGLETARVAALRGHQVTLYEKGTELGGQLNIAAKIPRRDDFAEVPRYYTYQMKLLGVEVSLGTTVTAEMVREKSPDAVVIATGSVPTPALVPGGDRANVVWVRDVLQEKVEVGQNVVVIAAEQHDQAMGVADFLVDKGKKVELLTPGLYAGGELEGTTMGIFYGRLLGKGVIITPLSRLKEIEEHAVTTVNPLAGVERRIEGVDTVVFAAIGEADDALYRALKGEVKEIYTVGQCHSPRKLQDSIWDGARVGRLL